MAVKPQEMILHMSNIEHDMAESHAVIQDLGIPLPQTGLSMLTAIETVFGFQVLDPSPQMATIDDSDGFFEVITSFAERRGIASFRPTSSTEFVELLTCDHARGALIGTRQPTIVNGRLQEIDHIIGLTILPGHTTLGQFTGNPADRAVAVGDTSSQQIYYLFSPETLPDFFASAGIDPDGSRQIAVFIPEQDAMKAGFLESEIPIFSSRADY